MSSIPPHYNNRYIQQRYNKALYIVQHLPTSSNVQPSKDQKLELYALYKQVSQGDIDTQRPGIFDVVGRAKWDAWHRLQGMSEMEAKHRYAETLLQAAKEAYKKPAGRAQAHQIIQSFAIMQPSGDSGDSSSEEEDEEEEAFSLSDDSLDAEERAYLKQIQQSTPVMNRGRPSSSSRYYRSRQHSSSRASSQSGKMSMMTAPTELRRPSASSSIRSETNARSTSRKGRELYDFDDSVNPWVLHPSSRQYRVDEQQQALYYRSPQSTSSSVTATQQQFIDQQQQHAILGPATKRALEALQHEIEALNLRIDGLRKELIERDRNKAVVKTSHAATSADSRGWRWVLKIIVKNTTAIHLMTVLVLLFVLFGKRRWIQRLVVSNLISKK